MIRTLTLISNFQQEEEEENWLKGLDWAWISWPMLISLQNYPDLRDKQEFLIKLILMK